MRHERIKKLVTLLLSATLALGMVPASASALSAGQTFVEGGITYTILTDTKVQVGDGNNPAIETSTYGHVVVPESVSADGVTYTVTSVGNRAFSFCSGVTSISLPDSVTSLGTMAFYFCSSLTSLTLPDTVTSIGDSAFWGCTGLTSLTLSADLTAIGANAFVGCSGLTSITLPDGLSAIGPHSFFGCTGLTSIVIPDGITTLAMSTFDGCSGLTSITLPEGLTAIGNNAFAGCIRLTSIIIPESVTSIGRSAFSGCSGLASLTIPENVTSIDEWAFHNCSRLSSVVFGGKRTYVFGSGVNVSYTVKFEDDLGERIASIVVPAGQLVTDVQDVVVPAVPVRVGQVGTWVAEEGFSLDGPVTDSFFLLPSYEDEIREETDEIAGDSKFDTAALIALEAYPAESGGCNTVIVATGNHWADATGGSALAGVLDAPILLVDTDEIPESVADALTAMDPSKIIILGGRYAVGEGLEARLQALPGVESVERIWGETLYDTADAVAARVIAESNASKTPWDGTAVFATGAAYYDALAVSPLAVAKKWPVFLVDPAANTLTPGATAALPSIGDAVVVGGRYAVSDKILSDDLAGKNPQRIWGDTWADTAAAIATFGVDSCDLSWNRVAIATGNVPFDALAGGVLQAKRGSVLLLTDSPELSPAAGQVLEDHKDSISSITYFGGVYAIPQAVRDMVEARLGR